jgi:hypothetical protein
MISYHRPWQQGFGEENLPGLFIKLPCVKLIKKPAYGTTIQKKWLRGGLGCGGVSITRPKTWSGLVSPPSFHCEIAKLPCFFSPLIFAAQP